MMSIEHKAKLVAVNVKHGMYLSYTYQKWRSMRDRCNPKTKNQKHIANYVSKGITVCDRWQSFENFLEDMGECPQGKQLDRIDNDKGYEPGNCRYVTRAENQANKKKVLTLTHGDVTRTLKEWSVVTGLAYQVLRYRHYTRRTPEGILAPIFKKV